MGTLWIKTTWMKLWVSLKSFFQGLIKTKSKAKGKEEIVKYTRAEIRSAEIFIAAMVSAVPHYSRVSTPEFEKISRSGLRFSQMFHRSLK